MRLSGILMVILDYLREAFLLSSVCWVTCLLHHFSRIVPQQSSQSVCICFCHDIQKRHYVLASSLIPLLLSFVYLLIHSDHTSSHQWSCLKERIICRVQLDYRDRYLTNPVLVILLIIQFRYLYQHFQSLPSVLISTSFTIRIKVRSFTILWSSSLICVMYIVVTEFHMSSVLNVLLFFGAESITLLLTFFIWIYREHEAPVDSLLPRYIFLFRFSIVLLSSFPILKSKTFLSSFTPIIVVRSPCHLVI